MQRLRQHVCTFKNNELALYSKAFRMEDNNTTSIQHSSIHLHRQMVIEMREETKSETFQLREKTLGGDAYLWMLRW